MKVYRENLFLHTRFDLHLVIEQTLLSKAKYKGERLVPLVTFSHLADAFVQS